MLLIVLFFLHLFSVAYLQEQSQPKEPKEDEFKYATILDHDNRVRLEWNVDKSSREIQFKLVVISLRKFPFLIGFGASDRGQFVNADLVIFELKSRNENVTYSDCYTDRKGVLKTDRSSDYVFDGFKLRRNTLEIKFHRKFDTCDPNDYRIEPGTVHLIHFTLGNNARFTSLSSLHATGVKFRPQTDADTSDMKQAQLVRSTYFDAQVAYFDERKHKRLEVVNERIRLPADDTTYWCRVFKLDEREFKLKHHIIAYESVISEASRGVAHHMELFHCLTDPTPNMRNYNGVCRSEAKPEGLTQCRQVIAAWAMGASRFVYPENVGGVIGGANYSPYLVLEVHFDNPRMRSDIVDSSGIRIYYQGGRDEPLRPYDAGVLEVGLEYNPKNAIPPQAVAFHLHGFCLSECTRASLARQPITVFGAQLHTHLTGRRVWTSLVRRGSLVKSFNVDNHFDQMFQEIRLLEEPVVINPGDAIINTCVFETLDRTRMTLGGYSIREEMCITYMHYYPAVELELCKSSIADAALGEFFDKMRYFDRANTSSARKSIGANFDAIRWTPMTAAMLSRLYDTAPLAFSCNRSDGTYVPNVYKSKESVQAGVVFKPIRIRNMTTRYGMVEASLRETCDNAAATPDYGFNDEDDNDGNDDGFDDDRDDL